MPTQEMILSPEIADTLKALELQVPSSDPDYNFASSDGSVTYRWDARGEVDGITVYQETLSEGDDAVVQFDSAEQRSALAVHGMARTLHQLGYADLSFERPGYAGTIRTRPSGRNLIQRAGRLGTSGQLRLAASVGFPKGPELARRIARDKTVGVAINTSTLEPDNPAYVAARLEEDHDAVVHGPALVALTNSPFLCDALVEHCDALLSELESSAEQSWAWRALKTVCQSVTDRIGRQKRAEQALHDFGGFFDRFFEVSFFGMVVKHPNDDDYLLAMAQGLLPNRQSEDVLNAVRTAVAEWAE